MKNILVTGAAGFIGSNLAEDLIHRGFFVTGLDNFDPFYDVLQKEANLIELQKHDNFRLIKGDIRSRNDLEKVGDIDVVVHLASKAGVRPSIENPEEYIDVNINGTVNLLNWMVAKGVKKMVFSSSSSVYGNNRIVPFSENDIVDFPISPYAFTKKSCELLNYSYHHLHKLDILNLRFFTVFGPRQRPDLAIRKFTEQLIMGKRITVYGNGSTSRDYTFVGDTVNGIISAMEYLNTHEKVYDTINIGNSYPVQLIELIETISEVVGKRPVLDFLPMQPGDVDRTYSDISKAKEMLNYSPKTSLKLGLELFYQWYVQTDREKTSPPMSY